MAPEDIWEIWAREQERHEVLAQQAPPKSSRRQTLRARAVAYRSLKKSGTPRGLPALAQVLTKRLRGLEAAFNFLEFNQFGAMSLQDFKRGIKMLGLNLKILCGMDAAGVFQLLHPNDDNKVELNNFLGALGDDAEGDAGERPILLAVFESAMGDVWRADFLGRKRLEYVVKRWAEANAPGVPPPEGLRVYAGRGGPDLPLNATLQALRHRLPIIDGRYGITVHWPEEAPEAASQGLDGTWLLPKGQSAVIQGERLRWPDGSQTELQRGSKRSLSMEYGGATHTSTLYRNGARLEWSNGQVWRKDDGSRRHRRSSRWWSSQGGRSRAQLAAIYLHYQQEARMRQPSPSRGRSRSRPRSYLR